MTRYMQGLNVVEAMPYLGCTDPSWCNFCAWCVERGIDLRYELFEHVVRLSLRNGPTINNGDFVIKTSGPHSRVIVVHEHEFTNEYIATVESITAFEIARELVRQELPRSGALVSQ